MTVGTKIHRQDPEEAIGIAVCGRKAGATRLTDDAAAVTCDVCTITSTRRGLPTSSSTRKAVATVSTVLDRLVGDDLLDLTPRGKPDPEELSRARGRATARAYRRLAQRHADEFRDLFRDEFAAAVAEVEELSHVDNL